MSTAGPESTRRLTVEGPVGAAGAGPLLAEARAVAAGAAAVHVDLSSAGHLHMLALQVLVALERDVKGAGGTFSLGEPSEAARDAILLAGLGRWL